MIQILKPLAALAALAVLGFAAATTTVADTVNDKCPISKKAVDGTTTSKVGDSEVGFCCGRCKGTFDGWSDAEKTAFVTQSGQAKATAAPAADKAGLASAPYLLDTCPVCDEKLDSTGEPVSAEIEGRQVKFCCESCAGQYKQDGSKFSAKMDKAMADQQRPYYALSTCVVAGEDLGQEPTETVIGNRLVLTCCDKCAKKVKENPAQYVAKIERANAEAQSENYPLTTCVVSGEELGSMGDPVETVVAGRLVKLCCKSCTRSLDKNPAEAVAAIDKAWAPIHAREASAKKKQ